MNLNEENNYFSFYTDSYWVRHNAGSNYFYLHIRTIANIRIHIKIVLHYLSKIPIIEMNYDICLKDISQKHIQSFNHYIISKVLHIFIKYKNMFSTIVYHT